jgi:hypothetical protein
VSRAHCTELCKGRDGELSGAELNLSNLAVGRIPAARCALRATETSAVKVGVVGVRAAGATGVQIAAGRNRDP